MKIKALFLLLALSALPAIAQDTDPTQTETEGPESLSTTALVEIMTAPYDVTELPLNEPVELDLSLLNVPGGTNDLAQGVVAKGYARSVEVDGKKIGQLVLTGVAKGERQEALNSSVFTSQFDLNDAQLKPDEPVTVLGDGPQLIEALKKLQEETSEEEEPAKEQVAATQNPDSTSTGESSNPDAAAYQSPDPIESTPDPVESVLVTSDGCSVRVDLTQRKAFVQSKTQVFKDGALESESECTDSPESFPIAKSYNNCTGQDIVDLEAMTATAQYQDYYVDAGGNNVTIGECQPDPELVFDIVEKHGACMVSLDYSTNQAVFQSQLVYMNQNNKEQQVRGCEASIEKPAVPMVQTTQGCSIRHDFGQNKSFRQSVWTYQDNGITYQAGSCLDDGTEFDHVVTYKDDSGDYLCSPINNGSTVTLQSRTKITVDGLSQFVTECQPDTATLAVQSTTEGCSNPADWDHDLSAGQSFAQERFYFEHDGTRQYLTECQNSTTTYSHEVEEAGWEAHDEQLFAYPKTTVYITTASGRYNIVTSEVLSGAPQNPYEFVRFDNLATGEVTYEGCEKQEIYANVKVWQRPDGTTHNEVVGTGTPTTSNACEVTTCKILNDWSVSTHLTSGFRQEWHGNYHPQCDANSNYFHHSPGTHSRNYNCTANLMREDGQIISSTQLAVNYSSTSYEFYVIEHDSRHHCLPMASSLTGAAIQNAFAAHGLPY